MLSTTSACDEMAICSIDNQAGEFCDGNEAVGLPYGESCYIGEVLNSDGVEATLNVESTFGLQTGEEELTLLVAEAAVFPYDLGLPSEGRVLICANAESIQFASELLDDGTLVGSHSVRAEDAAAAFISEDPLNCALVFTAEYEPFECHDQVGCSSTSPSATTTFLALAVLFVGRGRKRN